MTGVIVFVCAAFGLTVSKAKTEIICLRTKGMADSTTIFSVEAMGLVYRECQPQCQPVHREVDRRIRNAWSSFRNFTLELYDRPSAPLELKIRMIRAKTLKIVLYG